MAWYHDRNRKTYVATYKNEKEMQKEVEQAARNGWTIQNTAGVGGHINVGRTATRVALTGGVGLLFGASRSKDKITLTFVRDEEATASDAMNEALKAYKDSAATANDSAARERNRREALETRIKAARQIDGFEREPAEKDLEAALKQSIAATLTALEGSNKVSARIFSLRKAWEEAARSGAQVIAPIDFNAEDSRTKADVDRLGNWLKREQEMLASQQSTMGFLRDWQEASKRERKANERLSESEQQLAKARADLENVAPDRVEKAKRKLAEVDDERARREAELATARSEVTSRAALLEGALRVRGERAASLLESFGNPAPSQSGNPVAVPQPMPSVAAVAGEPNASSEDVLGQLERLASLHKAGALTDAEFASKKTELLSRL